MSGKALELEMSIAILVADHSHIAFIREDGGQHPCKSSGDAVVVLTNLEVASSGLRVNWIVDRGDRFSKWTLGFEETTESLAIGTGSHRRRGLFWMTTISSG